MSGYNILRLCRRNQDALHNNSNSNGTPNNKETPSRRLRKFSKPEPNYGTDMGDDSEDSFRAGVDGDYDVIRVWTWRMTVGIVCAYAAYFIILGFNILPKLSKTQMELVGVVGLTLALLLAGSLTNIQFDV